MKEQALAFSKCMRDHGIDMPDPTFELDGGGDVGARRKADGPEDRSVVPGVPGRAEGLPEVHARWRSGVDGRRGPGGGPAGASAQVDPRRSRAVASDVRERPPTTAPDAARRPRWCTSPADGVVGLGGGSTPTLAGSPAPLPWRRRHRGGTRARARRRRAAGLRAARRPPRRAPTRQQRPRPRPPPSPAATWSSRRRSTAPSPTATRPRCSARSGTVTAVVDGRHRGRAGPAGRRGQRHRGAAVLRHRAAVAGALGRGHRRRRRQGARGEPPGARLRQRPGASRSTSTGTTPRSSPSSAGRRRSGATRPARFSRATPSCTTGRPASRRSSATVGGQAAPGGAGLVEVTGTTVTVQAKVKASQQSLVHEGDAVDVELPERHDDEGPHHQGRHRRHGRPTTNGGTGASARRPSPIDITRRRPGGGAAALDQAPVSVKLTASAAKDVLAVPVEALLALCAKAATRSRCSAAAGTDARRGEARRVRRRLGAGRRRRARGRRRGGAGMSAAQTPTPSSSSST